MAIPFAARADGDLDETTVTPSSVRAKLDGETATMTARYQVPVEVGESSVQIQLPSDAVLVHAKVTVDGVTHDLALDRADAASVKFDDAQNAPVGGPKKAVVMISGSSGELTLSALSPRKTKLIADLEFSSATCFVDDHRYARIPSAWVPLVDPSQRRKLSERGTIGCGGEDDTKWIAFPSRELASQPSGDARIGATAGRLVVDASHSFARLEVDLAGRLSEIPPDLATVILIDGSRSMEQDELESQRALVESYVRMAGTTRVQVIAYARTARPLLPSWTMASVALPRLDRELRALVTRNGSNVDAGVIEAGKWLSSITGTKRVVLLGDDRLTNRMEQLDVESLAKYLPAGTLVHTVAIDDNAELVRGDGAFAKLAAVTKGLAMRGGADDGDPKVAGMLVRPMTLDDVTIHAPGWTENTSLGQCVEEDLREGESCTWWFDGDALAGPISVEGKLWGTTVTRMVRPDPTRGTALAREIVTVGSFDEALRTKIQDAAHSVNDGWSLYGAWGGKAGYDPDTTIGIGRYGTCCGEGTIGTATHDVGFGLGRIAQLDVKMQMRNALRACHAERVRAEITLETTMNEIASVAVSVSTKDAQLAHCIEEAIWDLALVMNDPPVHWTSEFGVGPL